jgi:hypothetical protein
MEATINNNFSWARFKLLARYYSPALRLQMILYPIIALIIGILTYISMKSETGIIFGGLIGTILSFMIYLSPLALTRRTSPVVEAMLPVTWKEKAVLLLGYFLIIIPILIYIPSTIGEWITSQLIAPNELQQTLKALSDSSTIGMYGLNYAPVVLTTSIALLVVISLTRNRAIMGLVWTIGTVVIMGMISSISSLAYIFYKKGLDGLAENAGSASHSIEENLAQSQDMVDFLTPVVMTVNVIELIGAFVVIYFIVRTIRRKQY